MPALHAAKSVSTIEMLANIVSFDTTSHRSNLDIITFIREWLDQFGIPYRISGDPSGTKMNLHAVMGPVGAGGIAFSGHVDTVSVEGQAWTGDPFKLRRFDGRLHARGTCDMKGFVAAMLAAVPDITRRRLVRPVHLFVTYDEEVGYHGARRLVDDLNVSGLKPAFCVVGEPSSMVPILAHKGRLSTRVEVHGLAAHSSGPHNSVNAVHSAAEAIAYLAKESRRFARQGPFEPGFSPPYTTVQVNSVECTALPNTVPAMASFRAEWRNIPADDPAQEFARFKAYVAEQIEPAMHATYLKSGFEYEAPAILSALSIPPDHKFSRAVCEAAEMAIVGKVSYCSEGSLYQDAHIASIVCGPGDVAQAHRPDEWITESQLASCDGFIRRLVDLMAV